MTQNLTGSWRGRVEIFMYKGSPRVRMLAGMDKVERCIDSNGRWNSSPSGTRLAENVVRVPRNIRWCVDESIGGRPNSHPSKRANCLPGIHVVDIRIISERHTSMFPVQDSEPATPPASPNEEYAGCDECGVLHKFDAATGCDIDSNSCKPDSNGWAHEATCSKVAEAPTPELPRVNVNDLPARPIDPDYIGLIERMLTAANRDGHGYPVAMIGPSQCGKTSIAVEIAKRAEASFFSNAFSMGLTEHTILGRLWPTATAGEFEWRDSQFVQAFETENSVYLADEFDAGDENCVLVFNTALANGWVRVAERHDSPMAMRALRVRILAAMNTYGTGSNIYVGRNQLDASTRQRFNPISVDYNPAWEWDVVYGGDNHVNVDRGQRDALAALTPKVRKAINDGRLRQVWSTTNITMAMAMMNVGFTLQDYTREQFAGWSDPERLVLTNNGVSVPNRG